MLVRRVRGKTADEVIAFYRAAGRQLWETLSEANLAESGARLTLTTVFDISITLSLPRLAPGA